MASPDDAFITSLLSEERFAEIAAARTRVVTIFVNTLCMFVWMFMALALGWYGFANYLCIGTVLLVFALHLHWATAFRKLVRLFVQDRDIMPKPLTTPLTADADTDVDSDAHPHDQ